MSALDDLTVCITSFHREDKLKKCVESVKAAGILNITVCCPEKDCGTQLDFSSPTKDVGCNNSWMLAAYAAKTKRIILMHDDDELAPEFGKVYEEIIAPALDKREAGFVSWEADLKYDDGHTEPCHYWQGTSALMPAHHLLKVVGNYGHLSLSPIVSVLNRTILIRACKEANDTLTTSTSILRDGMTLGTEIIVYLRHIQAFKRWLYLNKVLSYYGKHDGSGTVQAQKSKTEKTLCDGYDLARTQGSRPPPEPRSRLLLTYSSYVSDNDETCAREWNAKQSWNFHFNTAEMIEVPFYSYGLPKIRDILDHACSLALPEDIIVYANADAGMTTHAVERLTAGVARGNGVTFCGNRSLYPEKGRLYKNILQQKPMGGIDIIAMTPQWWKLHREKMPDMYIGREAWDNCFQSLAMEWADGFALGEIMFAPDRWNESKAHTDNVCWHAEHAPAWQEHRQSETSTHNRELALAFFRERGNEQALRSLK